MENQTGLLIAQFADLMDRISNIMGILFIAWMAGAANAISYFRMGLVGTTAWLLFAGLYGWAMVLVAIVVILDAVDGWVARALHTESELGAMIDRACDYYVAGAMWSILALLGTVSWWVPIITIGRDVIVLKSPTPTGKFSRLSSDRSIRFGYGALKLISWELAIWSVANPIGGLLQVVVWMTVSVCILRALPILFRSKTNSS